MADIPKSHYQRTVCLTNWWLIKSEENDFQGLGVAGFTTRGTQAKRNFLSAPILKRYDVFTLETTDGRCVILKGFINKDGTVENGFSPDVCDHFSFGFPVYWKEYEEKFMHGPTRSRRSKEKKDVKAKSRSKKSEPSAVPILHFDSGTPGEKEKGSTASPQSCSFSRSKSGRLRMPTLEFWRNQRAIYDVDGTITGLEEDDKELEQPSKKGCKSRRKRRQLI